MLAWFNAPPTPTLILVGDSWLSVQCGGGAQGTKAAAVQIVGGARILEGAYFLTPGFNVTLYKMKDWGLRWF